MSVILKMADVVVTLFSTSYFDRNEANAFENLLKKNLMSLIV